MATQLWQTEDGAFFTDELSAIYHEKRQALIKEINDIAYQEHDADMGAVADYILENWQSKDGRYN